MTTTDLTPLSSSDLAPVVALDRHPVVTYLASLTSENSRRSMRAALGRVVRMMTAGASSDPMGVRWQDVGYQHVQAVRTQLVAENYAPSTVNQSLAALRRVLRECFRLGLVDADALERATDVADMRSTRLPAGRYVSKTEQARLFEVCAHRGPGGSRDAALLALAFGCGLRRSEVVALDLSDYQPQTGRLTVRGKGRKDRLAFLTNGAKAAVDAWIGVRGDEDGPLLVPVRKGGTLDVRRMSAHAVYAAVEVVQAIAGVVPFTPHDARRTWVGELLDAGADLATVQALAGHASPNTTARYDRRPDEAKRRAQALQHVPFRG